jgi:hypothetical protein
VAGRGWGRAPSLGVELGLTGWGQNPGQTSFDPDGGPLSARLAGPLPGLRCGTVGGRARWRGRCSVKGAGREARPVAPKLNIRRQPQIAPPSAGPAPPAHAPALQTYLQGAVLGRDGAGGLHAFPQLQVGGQVWGARHRPAGRRVGLWTADGDGEASACVVSRMPTRPVIPFWDPDPDRGSAAAFLSCGGAWVERRRAGLRARPGRAPQAAGDPGTPPPSPRPGPAGARRSPSPSANPTVPAPQLPRLHLLPVAGQRARLRAVHEALDGAAAGGRFLFVSCWGGVRRDTRHSHP